MPNTAEQIEQLKDKAHDKIGGFWGDTIHWSNTEQFDGRDVDVFRAHGWKSKTPEAGQLILSEHENSWALFKILDVECCTDPKDMFFMNLELVEQVVKNNNPV